MRVKFFDIQWDTSDDDTDEIPSASACGLPSECVLEVEDDIDIEEEGADALSDQYCYCVFGFSYEVQ